MTLITYNFDYFLQLLLGILIIFVKEGDVRDL